PAWMTAPEAGATEIMEAPRLSVRRLIDLREFLDRIMVASSAREAAPAGGPGNEAMEETTVRPIRHSAARNRIVGTTASGSTGIARSPAGGGHCRKSRKATGGQS